MQFSSGWSVAMLPGRLWRGGPPQPRLAPGSVAAALAVGSGQWQWPGVALADAALGGGGVGAAAVQDHAAHHLLLEGLCGV